MLVRNTGLVLLCVLIGAGAVTAEDKPPAAGTMRFAKTAEAFPEVKGPQTFSADDRIYALVGFGRPWRELMKSTRKGTSAVTKLFVGGKEIKSHAFYPHVSSFDRKTFVLEVVPEPAKARQFTYNLPIGLAGLAPGKHTVKVQLWSFAGRTNTLAEGTFTFVATAEGQKKLLALAEKVKEAKAKAKAPPKKKPAGKKVVVRKGGSELLFFRGDEIVLNGSVVGKIEGKHVRNGGSIVGEVRGTLFRHEGSDKWSLDKGNLYAGREIRFEGSIIGDIRKDGTIWWEGSSWGSVKPYAGTDAETMRIFAALYYFSDFFKKK